jgi:hypothetical protein
MACNSPAWIEPIPEGEGGATTGVSSSNAGGAGGAAGAPSYPLGNAIIVDDAVVPIYPTELDAPRAVGFVYAPDELRAVDENGVELWQATVGAGDLFGGFDFDADGFVDVGLTRSEPSGTVCGSTMMLNTWLDVIAGQSGELFEATTPLESLCWTFGTTVYPTTQWSSLGLLFGEGPELVAFPYYAADGAQLGFGPGGFVEDATFVYPSTAQYDATYTADQPNPYGQPQSYVANSHVANGLIVDDRVVFFTSARVVVYSLSALSPDQLLDDTPFLSGGRTDIAGRNYGLVLHDGGRIVLLSGTSTDTMFADMQSGQMTADPWGQIERHVTLYDLEQGTVEDRFFSYAHDNNDGNQYEGRVVYPDNPLVGSRLAFNVYEGGHWQLHVTQPGTTADAVVFADRFLWDIRDLDLDGTDEWVVSPSRDPEDPDVPGYYFVKWRTLLAHWNDTTLELATERTIEGAIPYLSPTFRQPHKTSSRAYLYPALTVGTPQGMELLLWNGTLQRELL